MLLREHLPLELRNQKILFAGCSDASAEIACSLYDQGNLTITNADSRKDVIKGLLTKHMRERPKMRWVVMDPPFASAVDGSFEAVVQVEGIVIPDLTLAVHLQTVIGKYLEELKRLSTGSVIICQPLADLPDTFFASIFLAFGWEWKLCVSQVAEGGQGGSASSGSGENKDILVFTAHRVDISLVEGGLASEIVVVSSGSSNVSDRVVEAIQAENRARLEQGKGGVHDTTAMGECALMSDFDRIHPGRLLRVPVMEERHKKLRYWTWVVDAPSDQVEGSTTLCAVYIVPRGRENEWLHQQPEGVESLRAMVKTVRLVIVEMIRDEDYGTMKSVQAELNPHVMKLAQATAREHEKAIAYMTTDDGLGTRWRIGEAKSAMSGEIIVEDVQHKGNRVRRMVFLGNRNLIQSEVELEKEKRGKAEFWRPNYKELSFGYHEEIVKLVARQTWIGSEKSSSALVIGLGGGCLPMHLATVMNMRVTSVDLDEVVVDLAKRYFGVKGVELVVGDGLVFVAEHEAKKESGEKFQLIVVDAGSPDAALAMSCPPAPFVQQKFLSETASVLAADGILAINCVTRSKVALDAAVAAVSQVFAHVQVVKVEGDVNRVLFASSAPLVGVDEQQGGGGGGSAR